ncbi:type IVB secretion system protein IcmH/DotU [Legionella londiniensis]|uniref:IcmH (DotU) n=2 Tax=Legionella londiniensis TaxID=45068 RepID=A0A0W0VT41_9GAMM|nr:type IVB secretion system protein IcmH/DotU [Legionella londiniensis]KTD23265.1 IcmH (DotU) [Legionella londiniensis]STX93723.1 IcmH (DotU) [Legionella londiniensis]
MLQANTILPTLANFFTAMAELSPKICAIQEGGSIQPFRNRIKEALTSFELEATEQMVDPEFIYKAKYALVALVDECMIHVQGVNSWLGYPLQLELFGEVSAGARFFKFLADMRLQAEKWIDILEIYYICLELGYEGQYRLNDKFILLQLKKELFAQVQHIRQFNDPGLYVAEPKASAFMPPKNRFSVLKMAIGSVLLMFGFFASYQFAIGYQVKQDRKFIDHIYQQKIKAQGLHVDV